jgi:sulfate permease, SulP family
VLWLGTLQGILVAIITSLLGLALQTAHPKVHVIGRKRGADVLRPLSREHPDDETFEGLLIVRPEGRIYFANAESVSAQVRALVKQYSPRVVAFDMSRVPDIEYSVVKLLLDLDRRAAALGIECWLAALNPHVLEVVTRAGIAEKLGRERLLFNARAVIQRFSERRTGAIRGTSAAH